MIEYIAKKIEHNLKNDNEEIYNYGLQILLNTIASLLIVILLGTILDVFTGTIVFLLSYCLFRLFAGGLHVSTNIRCIMIFVFGYIMVAVFMGIIHITFNIEVAVSLIVINLITCILAPVVDMKNPVSLEKAVGMRKRAVITSLIITSVVFLLLYGNYRYGEWGYAGVSWACILLVAGKIKNTLMKRRQTYELK